MYGWDSYFIVIGLEADNHPALAKGMVDNFLFEIEHYGAVLNANRTYYLTRSQPPFLTSMIRAVYENPASFPATPAGRAEARHGWNAHIHWLKRTTPHGPGRTPRGTTGLTRYYDFASGRCLNSPTTALTIRCYPAGSRLTPDKRRLSREELRASGCGRSRTTQRDQLRYESERRLRAGMG